MTSRKGGFFCIYRGCNSRTGEGLSFFSIPKDRVRAEDWLKNCNRLDLVEKNIQTLHKNYKVCELHFQEKHISKSGIRKTLFQQAYPTMFSHLKHKNLDSTEEPSKKLVILEGNKTSFSQEVASAQSEGINMETSSQAQVISVGVREQSSTQDDDSMQEINPPTKVVVLENIIVTPGENDSAANPSRSPSPTTKNSQPNHILECILSKRLAQTSTAVVSDTPSKMELENNVRLLRMKNLQLEEQLKECERQLQKTKEQVMQDITLDDYMTLTYKFCGNNMELAYFINVQVSQMEEE